MLVLGVTDYFLDSDSSLLAATFDSMPWNTKSGSVALRDQKSAESNGESKSIHAYIKCALSLLSET